VIRPFSSRRRLYSLIDQLDRNSFALKILTCKLFDIKILQTIFAKPAPIKPFRRGWGRGYPRLGVQTGTGRRESQVEPLASPRFFLRSGVGTGERSAKRSPSALDEEDEDTLAAIDEGIRVAEAGRVASAKKVTNRTFSSTLTLDSLRRGHGIAVQCNRAVAGQGSSGQSSAGIERDRFQAQDVSLEN